MLRKMAQEEEKEENEGGEEEKEEDEAVTQEDSKYMKFWKKFGKNVKLGVIEDSSNRSKLAKLLRFQSTKSGESYTSLQKYVENMKEWQKSIYFIAGENMDAIKNSPFLERLVA